MPKINREEAIRVERQAYPGKLLHRTDGCWKTKLSDQAGLTQMGIGEVELAPGSATGLLHYHNGADEMVFVLEGTVTLVEEGSNEVELTAGDSAAWKAGDTIGHTIENRSNRPARLLEIGTRPSEDTAIYPGLDMMYRAINGTRISIRTRAGAPFKEGEEVRSIEDPAPVERG
ncbi:MAG: cupin domain-containing protein [Pseudomonadota bacterium]